MIIYKLYTICIQSCSDLKLKLYIFCINFLNCYTHQHTYTHTRTHARARKLPRTHVIPTYRGIVTYGRKMSGKITQTLTRVKLLGSANRRRYWCRWTEDPVDVMKREASRCCVYLLKAAHSKASSSENQEFVIWAPKILLTRFSIIEIKIFPQILERHITNTTIFLSCLVWY